MWSLLFGCLVVGYVNSEGFRDGSLYNPANEEPAVHWRPSAEELVAHGLSTQSVAKLVKSSGSEQQYICDDATTVEKTGKLPRYNQLTLEKQTLRGLYAVTKCDCLPGDGGEKCRGSYTKRSKTDDRCVAKGVAGVLADMECRPLIIDITVNTQGHGTYGDAKWEKDGASSRPYAQPHLGPESAGSRSWEHTPIHPYRLSCPIDYILFDCHVNAPRQHNGRSCPVRRGNLHIHTLTGVSPAHQSIDSDRPLIYADYERNICQTTKVMNSYDEKTGKYRLDPYAGKMLQARCLLAVF